MRNAIELDEEILDRICGGSHFKNQDYVTSTNDAFGGIAMITGRQIDSNGNYTYSVWVLDQNRIYNQIPEDALKGM